MAASPPQTASIGVARSAGGAGAPKATKKIFSGNFVGVRQK